jgi:hypothetical protein
VVQAVLAADFVKAGSAFPMMEAIFARQDSFEDDATHATTPDQVITSIAAVAKSVGLDQVQRASWQPARLTICVERVRGCHEQRYHQLQCPRVVEVRMLACVDAVS